MNKIRDILKFDMNKNLQSIFKKLPIDVVYLYGSMSREENDQMSDYDIGVHFEENLSPKKRFDLRLQLFGDIAEALKVVEDNIDVVDLAEVPLLLQFNVISGKVIFCRSEDRRIQFEAYVMSRYHDEHYYYDRYLAETLEKIRKGVYFDRRLSYA